MADFSKSSDKNDVGAVGGEAADSVDERINEQAAFVLRGYIVQAAHEDDPDVLLSQEDLGGSQSESQDPEVKEIVRNLIQIGDELNRNAELQYLIDHIQLESADLFYVVAERIFENGINWGRVVALFHFAYKLIYKAVTTNCRDIVRKIMGWALNFFRRHVSQWIREQGGWETVQYYFQNLRWHNVAIFVAGVLTGALAYWKMT
ncbi:apoptosis regulator BAX-like [Acipenser oxyrinchus oxyrinchus]|uniref:Apoptosis regulator BAX-like n=1 Tax=Acipenser oxyrinchus oxyrinchus TaxID=40147 RepID=A0AAD8FXG9_ACIOX|nr:apoptosis regulator BAX-like [Acipenser oxyrinchus oxyrinchus]